MGIARDSLSPLCCLSNRAGQNVAIGGAAVGAKTAR